jgi:hypothetical protein
MGKVEEVFRCIGYYLRMEFVKRLKKCSNNYGKSLPELRQRLSAGFVKRIDEAFPRFCLMH